MMSLLRIFFLCFPFCFITLISAQTTYYVSKNGNNSNNGLTPETAFETLQYAADIVTSGDSVLVLLGNYVGFDIRKNGNQNSPIVFKSIESNVVIDERNSVTPDGINRNFIGQDSLNPYIQNAPVLIDYAFLFLVPAYPCHFYIRVAEQEIDMPFVIF